MFGSLERLISRQSFYTQCHYMHTCTEHTDPIHQSKAACGSRLVSLDPYDLGHIVHVIYTLVRGPTVTQSWCPPRPFFPTLSTSASADTLMSDLVNGLTPTPQTHTHTHLTRTHTPPRDNNHFLSGSST